MASSRSTQNTLFDYAFSSSRPSRVSPIDNLADKDLNFDSDNDKSDSPDDFTDPTPEIEESSGSMTSRISTSHNNSINLTRPSGSTNIYIGSGSNQSPTDTSSSTSSVTLPALDIAQSSRQPPVQPVLKYPNVVLVLDHLINKEWYSKYKWLEYSKSNDSVFCYPCQFFSMPGKSRDTFTHSGFCDWKPATGHSGILQKHDTSYSHKESMASWSEFMRNSEQGTSIANIIDSSRKNK